MNCSCHLRSSHVLRGFPTAASQPQSLRFRKGVSVQASSGTDDRSKTALITGGNTGIGFATARTLAQKGFYVVIGCRDGDKALAAQAKIKGLVPGAKVEVARLDLAELATVRDFAARALDKGFPLDVLINNAGVMAPPEMRTKDGFELQMGVNHLGHYALTNLLLPLLTNHDRRLNTVRAAHTILFHTIMCGSAASSVAIPLHAAQTWTSRIINVSSLAHQNGHINFDDLQSRRNYQRWAAYGQSKLANVLFTYELARRLPVSANTTVNALHPGIVNTELQRFLVPEKPAWWLQPLLQAASLFVKTPEQGAATSIYLASSPEVEGLSSKYFADCKAQTSSQESYDTEVARRLWDVSAELTGVEAKIPQAMIA